MPCSGGRCRSKLRHRESTAIRRAFERSVTCPVAASGPVVIPAHPQGGNARHPGTSPCKTMKATELLHNLGQSLWLDNITRDLLDSGTLQRYIDELSVTGLTSNPTIFGKAIEGSASYDADISRAAPSAKSREDLFFGLALADLTRAADLFKPVF